jgi:hypothetical protein
MSSAFEKEELRELCRKYVPASDLESLLSQEQRPFESVPTAEPLPSPPVQSSSSSFHCPLEKVSTAQLKRLLLLLVTELPSPGSEVLRRGIASAVERSELEALCDSHISSEEEFERLYSSLLPPKPAPSSDSPSEPPQPPPMTETTQTAEEDSGEEEEEDFDSGESPASRYATRKMVFRSILTLTALDDGSCLRGMLFKRSRRSLFQSWNERFWILSYSLLSLRYFKISR